MSNMFKLIKSKPDYTWASIQLPPISVVYQITFFESSEVKRDFGRAHYHVSREGDRLNIYLEFKSEDNLQQKTCCTALWKDLKPILVKGIIQSNRLSCEMSIRFGDRTARWEIVSADGKKAGKIRISPDTFESSEIIEILRRIAASKIKETTFNVVNLSHSNLTKLTVRECEDAGVSRDRGTCNFEVRFQFPQQSQPVMESYKINNDPPYHILRQAKGAQVMDFVGFLKE